MQINIHQIDTEDSIPVLNETPIRAESAQKAAEIQTMTKYVNLFVYGIFLDESMRQGYSMTEPEYAVVKGFATHAMYWDIVEARRGADTLALTGLLVRIPEEVLPRLDQLEHGYDRITVTTVNGDTAYMYAAHNS